MDNPSSDALCAILDRCTGTDAKDIGRCMRELIEHELAAPPLPGHGKTIERWRVLATVAAHDLCLAKLYEAHADALAILAELQSNDVPQGMWAVWCAEPPDGRVTVRPGLTPSAAVIDGIKRWCSGAGIVDRALVSAWSANGAPCLVAVDLRQPAVEVMLGEWHAVGMAATASNSVRFEGAAARQIGEPGQYVNRAGFWPGGAGIAACWYGAAAEIARRLYEAPRLDAHGLAHLGAVDVALRSTRALMYETAQRIDAQPTTSHRNAAMRLRLAVEHAVDEVLRRVPRALGPAPLCNDSAMARLMADLPVFIRQSHAERDLAALGEWLRESPAETTPWQL